MSQCQVCTAATPNTFLCNPHIGELRATLTALAHGGEVNRHPTEGLLGALADVANKQTRMGGGTGHRKRGDEMPSPFEPDTEKGRRTKQGEASMLLDEARNTLSTIIRALCEERGLQPPAIDTPEMAVWLAGSVNAISLGEDAGRTWADADALRRRIERVIDRPISIELLGFCATELTKGKPCGTALRAPEDAIEVYCRKCHTTRRCDWVRRTSQSDARRTWITWSQVLEVNKRQPEAWRVNERTLRDWRSTGALVAHYLRPEGGYGIHRHGDEEPVYKWDDIERLRSHGVPRGGRKRTRAGV